MSDLAFALTMVMIVLGFLAVFIGIYQRGANRRAAATEGVRLVGGKCSACGGNLTPGDVYASAERVFHFRGGGKIRAIGAARCEQCGQVMFFA